MYIFSETNYAFKANTLYGSFAHGPIYLKDIKQLNQ